MWRKSQKIQHKHPGDLRWRGKRESREAFKPSAQRGERHNLQGREVVGHPGSRWGRAQAACRNNGPRLGREGVL